jgi:hypothetical protein
MNAALAIQLLLSLLDRAGQIGALINTAQSQGRDITKEELDALASADDDARAKLQAAIDAAKQKP